MCDALQCFATSGPDPCPVPHLGLSTVDPDASVRVQVLLQRCVNGTDAMWVWSDDVNVVKESANHFILSEFFLSSLQGGMLANEYKKGMGRPPLHTN